MANYYAIARHQFVPATERELAFDAGDKILLFNWDDPEWWYGEVHGKSGYFPSSYVELENEDDVPPPPPPEDDFVPPPPAEGKTVTAIYDSTAESDRELSFKAGDSMKVLDDSNAEWLFVYHISSKKQGYVPKNFVEASNAGQATSSRPNKPSVATLPKNSLENQFVAIYDFKAQTSEQLSFSAGAFIKVLDKSDKDWWVGQIGNQQGSFPKSYVDTPSAEVFELIEKNKKEDAIVTPPPVPLHKTSSFISSNPILTAAAPTTTTTQTTTQPKATSASTTTHTTKAAAAPAPAVKSTPSKGTPAPSKQPASSGEKVCHSCKGEIGLGAFMEVDTAVYHKTCFVCSTCSTQLKKFYEKGGMLYCHDCYHKVDGEPCGRCNKPLGASVVKACGKRFHETCFTCFKCKGKLGNVVNNRDGQPWCDNCCRQNIPANKPTSKSANAPKRGVLMPKQKWVSGLDY